MTGFPAHTVSSARRTAKGPSHSDTRTGRGPVTLSAVEKQKERKKKKTRTLKKLEPLNLFHALYSFFFFTTT